jgi:hypothetical protein
MLDSMLSFFNQFCCLLTVPRRHYSGMMKKLVVSFALLLALVCGVSAQVTVDVVMDQNQFVPNESIPVKVRVVNHSGQTLQFGSEDWLSFSVEARDGLEVLKSGEPPQAHDFDVKSSEVATTAQADLAPYFTVDKPGRYAVTATVHIKDWDRAVVSKPKFFEVVRGQVIWEQDIGLPQSATNHSAPEVRKYQLQQATMSRAMKLYLRISDSGETRTFRVVPIGPLISFSDPQTRIDQSSQLHAVHTRWQPDRPPDVWLQWFGPAFECG